MRRRGQLERGSHSSKMVKRRLFSWRINIPSPSEDEFYSS